MRSDDVEWERLRFLPVGTVEAGVLEIVLGALSEVILTCAAEADERCGRAATALAEVQATLMLHQGSADELCLVSRDAVFSLVAALDSAAALLLASEQLVVSLAVEAVAGRVMATIAEAQPAAPA